MRIAALALVALALSAAPARAEFVMCINGQGISPPPGTTVPPHAHLVYFTDENLGTPQKVSARIDGKTVAVKRTEVRAAPFKLITVEIDSDRTGALEVTWDTRATTKYVVKARAMPEQVTGVIGRYQGRTRRADVGDAFDGLAIRLPEGTPAVIGHVKVRHAEADPWLSTDIAIITASDETRPMIRVGRFDCAANIPLSVLAQGFDLEVSVTLLDGTTRTVEGLAPHLTLPAPLPPQPRANALLEPR
jgi:hypothetical protein